MGFTSNHQPNHKVTGSKCLKIVAKHYGKTISLQQFRQLSETTRVGISLLGLSKEPLMTQTIFGTLLLINGQRNKLINNMLPIIFWAQEFKLQSFVYLKKVE